MAVSVRMEPLMEKDLELAARRLGITKSQFIITAVERALGRKNPYELLLKVRAEAAVHEPGAGEAQEVPDANLAPHKAALRAKLRAKHAAEQADWLAYQQAKQRGEVWIATDAQEPI